MDKEVDKGQIVFSKVGFAGSALLFVFILLSSQYTLTSLHVEEVISALLYLACLMNAAISFAISIYRPVALFGLILTPVFFISASYMGSLAYHVTPKYEDVLNHPLIGSVVAVRESAYLISQLPKKRMKSYDYLCKHDFQLDWRDKASMLTPPKKYWKTLLRTDYIEPIAEDVAPDSSFKIVGAFKCDRYIYLSLEDSKGRLIEVNEIMVNKLYTSE